MTSDQAFPRGHPRTLGRAVRALDAHMRAHPSDVRNHFDWLADEED